MSFSRNNTGVKRDRQKEIQKKARSMLQKEVVIQEVQARAFCCFRVW